MPATEPMIMPTTTATAIAESPTASEMRPPYSIRASRSWPRSSVPNGWPQDGPSRWAVKSISLTGTGQISGPNATASAIRPRIARPATASRWRRKRRQASRPGETCRARPGAAAAGLAALAIGDARVEPAIKDVGDKAEQDDETGEDEGHRHDDRRVVGQHRADQQGADTGD